VVGAGVADAGAAVAVPDDEGGGGGVDELAGWEMQMPPTRIAGGVQLGAALLEVATLLDGAELDGVGVGVGVGVGSGLTVNVADLGKPVQPSTLQATALTVCLPGAFGAGIGLKVNDAEHVA